MINILLYIFIVIFVILAITLEKKIYNNYLTPFTLLSVPYCSVVLYQMLCIKIYDFKKITPMFLIIIFIFLFTTWFSGILYNSILIQRNINVNRTYNINSEKNYRIKFIELISIISSTYLLLFFIFNMKNLGNIGQIVQEQFQTEYTSGINFYLRLISMIGAIYFFGISNFNNKKFVILGIYSSLPIILTFVKGMIFIICLGSVIANTLVYKRKIKVKSIIYTIMSGIIIFFLVYMIETGIWNPEKLFKGETYEYIFANLNVYLTSGVQSFNVNLQQSSNIFNQVSNPVYAPIINIISKIGIAERIDSINNIWSNLGYIRNYGNVLVNTNTYIGTLVLYCGIFKGLLIHLFISIIMYHLFYKMRYKDNIIYIVRYSLFITGFILGWFEYYYMHTFWIYLIIILYMFKVISKIKLYIN